jgi:pSer/pThr/pTyr-binding forkhead associated (FHA) protein
MIKIVVFYEDNQVKEHEQADEKPITIGRAPGCTIQLDETSISRLHAVIRFESGSWLVERKANFGAILLNGQEVENAPLEGGEEIAIGKFSLRLDIEEQLSTRLPVAGSSREIQSEDDDGRTRFVSASVIATLKFEPGAANLSEFLIEKDLVLVGRGSNCDVVLTEKKASRKHYEIRKQGLSFVLKDLNSANGTLVNGSPVTEVELVPGDMIAVGEARCQFSVENKSFFSQQDQFLPVPAHLEQADGLVSASGGGFPLSVGEAAQGGSPGDLQGGSGITGISDPEPAISNTDFIGRAKRAWSNIPKAQRMRYLTILVVFALITALLGGPDEAPKPKPKVAPGSKAARSFENLTEAKKKFVRDNYTELLKAQEKKDFNKMREFAASILTHVDDYKDTKIYESMAIKGIEDIKEKERIREQEALTAKRRKEVEALVEKGREIFEKALEDAKFRPQLLSVIQEIYTKDPNSSVTEEWKRRIREREEEEKRKIEEAQLKEELRLKAEDAFAKVESIYRADKYVEALEEAEKLADLEHRDSDFLDRVDKLKAEIRGKLSSIVDPLLRDAKIQTQEGGDLVKARDLFQQILKVDSRNREARDGLESIREVLLMRAKRLFTEAAVAESVSDLAEAREKFKKCYEVAPDENVFRYKERCRNKLRRFEAFDGTRDF